MLLDLGLEDLIPLPEAATQPELIDALDEGDEAWKVLARILLELVRERRVALFKGRWDDNDPPQLTEAEALALLPDTRWYSYRLDDPEEERVYYVNVENLLDFEPDRS